MGGLSACAYDTRNTEGQSISPQSRFQTLGNDVVDDVAVNVG